MLSKESTSLLIEFERHRLGSILAWDTVENLLAVELQPRDGTFKQDITFCILDPSRPEEHFLARIPAQDARGPLPEFSDSMTTAPECLTHLLWSPLGTERVLLAVTTHGRAFCWTQEDPSLSQAIPQVRCINRWFGEPAFTLDEDHASASSPMVCRFLRPPSLWDVHAAPPGSTREGFSQGTVADLQSFWGTMGLQKAFLARRDADGDPAGSEHWLRRGMLCCAVITHKAQLRVFFRSFGGVGQRHKWTGTPPISLPLPAPLACLDVVSGPRGTLRVLGSGIGEDAERLVVAEVAGALCMLEESGEFCNTPQVQMLSLTSVGSGSRLLHACFIPAPSQTLGTCALSVLHDTLHGNVRVALLSEHTSAAATAYRQQYPGAGSTGWNCLAEHVVLEGGSLTEPSAGSIQVHACPLTSLVAVGLPGGGLKVMEGLELKHVRGGVLTAAAKGCLSAPACLASSPNGTLLALAPPGSNTLILDPLLPLPSSLDAAGRNALQISKRVCFSLVAATSNWDCQLAMRQLSSAWGAQPLRLLCDLVDTAVHAEPMPSRDIYCSRWDLLKARLLHPSPPDTLAHSLAVDLWMRGWMAHACRLLEKATPGREEVEAMRADKGTEGLEKLLISRSQMAGHWVGWVSDIGLLLLRSLMLWTENRKAAAGQRAAPSTPNPFGPKFAVEQGGGGGDDWLSRGSSLDIDVSAWLVGSTAGADEAGERGTSVTPEEVLAAQQAAQAAQRAWAAEVDAGPDCVPGPRLMGDAAFCRNLKSALSNATLFASRLKRLAAPGSLIHKRALQLPDLYKGFQLVVKLVQEKGVSEGLPPPPDAGTLQEVPTLKTLLAASQSRVSGPWSLHYSSCNGGPAVELVAASVARIIKACPTLQNLKPPRLEDLLHDAHLQSMPPQGHGWDGMAAPMQGSGTADLPGLYRLLTSACQAEFARLEGSAELPELEGWDGGWGEVAEEPEEEGAAIDLVGAAPARSAPAGRQAQGVRRKRLRELWEIEGWAWRRERDAALGTGGVQGLQGQCQVDVITGKTISWETPPTYASPSGALATQDLKPRDLHPGTLVAAQQLPWLHACPISGEGWRKL